MAVDETTAVEVDGKATLHVLNQFLKEIRLA